MSNSLYPFEILSFKIVGHKDFEISVLPEPWKRDEPILEQLQNQEPSDKLALVFWTKHLAEIVEELAETQFPGDQNDKKHFKQDLWFGIADKLSIQIFDGEND